MTPPPPKQTKEASGDQGDVWQYRIPCLDDDLQQNKP